MIKQFKGVSQRQVRAIAFALKTHAPVNGDVVAIVNIGRMGSLQREWENAIDPTVLYPPISMSTYVTQRVLISIPLAGLAYGYYRLAKRFPKTTVGLTLPLIALSYGFVQSAIYPDLIVYGERVRGALASPIHPASSLVRPATPSPVSVSPKRN